MSTWTSDELNKIGNAEELQVASLRQDGTLRKLMTIWVVRLGDNLYVRSVKGRTSDWFRGVQTRHEGHIRTGGSHQICAALNHLMGKSYGYACLGSVGSIQPKSASLNDLR